MGPTFVIIWILELINKVFTPKALLSFLVPLLNPRDSNDFACVMRSSWKLERRFLKLTTCPTLEKLFYKMWHIHHLRYDLKISSVSKKT